MPPGQRANRIVSARRNKPPKHSLQLQKKTIPAVVFIKIQSNSPDLDENGNTYQNPYDFNGDEFFNRFFLAIPTVETSLKSPAATKPRVPDSL